MSDTAMADALPDEGAVDQNRGESEAFGTAGAARDPDTGLLPVDPIVLEGLEDPRLGDEIAIDAQREEGRAAKAEAARNETAEAAGAFHARMVDYAKAHGDDPFRIFDENLVIPPPAAEFIQTSDFGPQIATYFADHPTFGEQLAGLDKVQIVQRMEHLQLQLNPGLAKISKAPDPVPTVGGGGSSGRRDPANMKPAEYFAWRNGGGGA
jgi:hypothetical protein